MSDGYSIIEADGKFELRSSSGRCVMVCGDRHSAEHYLVLLNEAFASGYRQACRDRKAEQG